MKKIIIFALSLVIVSFAADAQTDSSSRKNKKAAIKEKAKQLNLTDDQKKKLGEYRKEGEQKRKEVMNDNSLTKEQKDAKLKHMKDEYKKKSMGVLDDKQKKQIGNWRKSHKKKGPDKGTSDKPVKKK